MVAIACGCNVQGSSNGAASLVAGRALAAPADDQSEASRELEPNDLLEDAQLLQPDRDGAISLAARLDWSEDVDVFRIAPPVDGEGRLIEVNTGSGVDVVVALFDPGGNVRTLAGSSWTPARPVGGLTLPASEDAWYVGVAASAEVGTPGAYQLTILPGEHLPPLAPREQVVVLNFTGASEVALGDRVPVDIPPFDAGGIDPALADSTDYLADVVLAQVRRDFEGLNVQILTSAEGLPPDTPFSTVHLGGCDTDLLGLANGVDQGNVHRDDVAVVFADSFAALMELEPTVEELGQALANVASHEIGHLLGLVHAVAPGGLMDITAVGADLLEDRSFARGTLDRRVFPIGQQDAAACLEACVGGNLQVSDLPGARLSPADTRAVRGSLRCKSGIAPRLASCPH